MLVKGLVISRLPFLPSPSLWNMRGKRLEMGMNVVFWFVSFIFIRFANSIEHKKGVVRYPHPKKRTNAFPNWVKIGDGGWTGRETEVKRGKNNHDNVTIQIMYQPQRDAKKGPTPLFILAGISACLCTNECNNARTVPLLLLHYYYYG